MGAALLGQHLPGHDVRVVFHFRDEDFVPLVDLTAAVAVGDQVDGLGGAADEDDLARLFGADEPADLVAGRLVRGGGALAQLVDAAVDVGALLEVAPAQPVEHGERFLCGGRAVEVDQRVTVRLAGEGGEVPPHAFHVEGARQGGAQGRAIIGARHHGIAPSWVSARVRLTRIASSSPRRAGSATAPRPSRRKAATRIWRASFSPMPRERR